MKDGKHCILIADDEKEIREILRLLLEGEGYAVLTAADGAEALAKAAEEVDLYILDVNMPVLSGFPAAAEIRKQFGAPIIFLTAYSTESDKVMGFSVGADDYIVKPFSPGEVMARIRAVMRRIPASEKDETLVIGTLSIHMPSLSVTLDGHKLNLTRREVELLYTLAGAPGRVFTRDNLLTMIWGYEFAGNYRAVDSHIKRLRAKLDAYPHPFFSIATVWGAGYRFERNLP